MTDFTYTNIDIPHVPSTLDILAGAFRTWRQRARERRQLALLSPRDVHDLGLTEQQVQFEINKPFWQA
jgi:uncharacterized protein YjiS (DUF1127 family)